MKKLIQIFLLAILTSCFEPNTVKWNFPLHGTNKQVLVELPKLLEDYKISIHMSDCKSCKSHETVFSSRDFLDKVPETTGFYSPWKIDTTALWYLYFDVQLNKDTFHPVRIPDFKKELLNIESFILSIDSNAKITSRIIDSNFLLVSYERINHNSLKRVKGIDGITFLDSTWMGIHYLQFDSLDNGLTESLVKCLNKIEVK